MRPAIFGVVIAAALLCGPRDASGIPAFARKYRVTCAMCHAPIPRLNAVGERFAANGFQFAPGEEPRDTIGTGDPLLRLQNTLPLAIRYDAYVTGLSKHGPGEVATDQQLPWIIKLLSGGQVSHGISYYAYFLLTERGEVAGLEDAFVQFANVGGTGVDLTVGQFQVSDPIFKRELRLPYEDYQPYRVRVGASPADITYDRGMMASWSPREGTDVVFEILNGQGLNAASDAKQYDADGYKTFALRVSQDVGPLRLGGFGYIGREGAEAAGNRIRILGPDLTLPLASTGELNVQLLRRWDDDPFFGACSVATPCAGGFAAPFSTTVDAAMVEATLWPAGPAGRLFLSALGNYVESDQPVVSLRLGETGLLRKYRTGAFGVHYLLRRNVRVLGEADWDFEADRGRLVSGFTLAF